MMTLLKAAPLGLGPTYKGLSIDGLTDSHSLGLRWWGVRVPGTQVLLSERCGVLGESGDLWVQPRQLPGRALKTGSDSCTRVAGATWRAGVNRWRVCLDPQAIGRRLIEGQHVAGLGDQRAVRADDAGVEPRRLADELELGFRNSTNLA